MLNVRAGSMACRSRSAAVTAAASIPAGTESPTGSQPSHTAKIKSSRIAIQNAGVLEITRQYPRISRSGHLPRHAPAITPIARPSTPEITHADKSTQKELTRRSPITVSTGCR